MCETDRVHFSAVCVRSLWGPSCQMEKWESKEKSGWVTCVIGNNEDSTEVTEGEKEKEMNSEKCLYLFTLMTLQSIPHG